MGATSFHVGIEAFGEDETAPCACAACCERTRMRELVAAAQITRLTAIHAPRAAAEGTDPWTVYVTKDGHVAASGRGRTEEEAIHEALRVLGVVA